MELVNSDKIYNFPVTISGLLNDQCVTLIESPDVFDNNDILRWLSEQPINLKILIKITLK